MVTQKASMKYRYNKKLPAKNAMLRRVFNVTGWDTKKEKDRERRESFSFSFVLYSLHDFLLKKKGDYNWSKITKVVFPSSPVFASIPIPLQS